VAFATNRCSPLLQTLLRPVTTLRRVDSFDVVAFQWQDGERRLKEEPPDRQRVLYRVVDGVVAELRRRLGGPFTVEELSALYDRGTDWCLDVATAVAPDEPRAWEADTVADAAFARYLREAVDYAGGRRLD
jgi:hypothetical protein